MQALRAGGAGPFTGLTGCENHQLFGWAGSRPCQGCLGCQGAPQLSLPHHPAPTLVGGLDESPGCSWGGGEQCPRPHRASLRHTGSEAGAPSQITCFHPKPAKSGSAGPQTPGMWGQTQLSAVALHDWQHRGVGWHHRALNFSANHIPTQGADVHHPGYGVCKGLFFRKGTSSRHRAHVRSDKHDTYPLINPMGMGAPL